MSFNNQIKILKSLAAAELLEKQAQYNGDELAQESAAWLGRAVRGEFMTALKQASVSTRPLDMIDYLLTIRDSQASTGTKHAADAESIQECTTKLAAAFVVDNALTAQMNTGTEQEKVATAETRALGREYIAHLAQLLLS